MILRRALVEMGPDSSPCNVITEAVIRSQRVCELTFTHVQGGQCGIEDSATYCG